MSTPSRIPGRPLIALAAATSILLGLALPGGATVNEDVWKSKYGVTAAQWANPNFLTNDDDKDGVKNGDEIAAGTNPFDASKTIKVSSVNRNVTDVTLDFPTEAGKRYRIEATASLSSPSWVLQPQPIPTAVVGTGNPMSITVPYATDNFYRVKVDDADSDGDGMGDWAEKITGYNPNDPTTDGSVADGPALTSAIAALVAPGVVTVTVTKPTATQPPAGQAAIDTGSLKVRRSGLLRLGTLTAPNITVPLLRSGTAVENTDYDTLVSPAAFTAGVSEVIRVINPKANASRKTNMTAIVTAQAGGTGSYTIGAAASGSVVINPAGIANGTGLTGRYQNTSNSTYATQTSTIFNTAAEMTRTDATINFSTGVNGWGSTAGPTGMSPASANNAFSVRWTGQILPQYSETYTIDFRSDDSAKVWVNGQLLIDRWTTQAATDYVNSIALTGGVLYDIVVEYWNNAASTTAEAKLSWWSPSQTTQIIPAARLFPEPTQANKLTAITSSLAAVGYVSVPFSFSVTSPNISGATTYALAANSGPLPTGLTLAASGVISGTPTTAGTWNVAVNATNTAAGTVTGSSIIDFTIYPAGGVTREILSTTAGGKVSNIVIPADNPQPTHDTIATIDDDVDRANNVGVRLRGYLVPPRTGNYYFWIWGSSAAELWISNDSQYVNKVRRAWLTVGSTTKKAWSSTVNATQSPQSPWISLVAGQKYYFEVLQNTGITGITDDHVAVGWCQDDVGTVPAVTGAANPTATTPIPPSGGAVLQGYPLSGTVPGYIFQPYDYPVLAPPTGTLYAGNMGPQASAITSASGSTNLQVNAAKTEAILHFSYQNLTSPRTAYHLHVDSYTSDPSLGSTVHPQGEIIFDIDDADAFPPELRTADGGYKWVFAPTGSFASVDQVVEAIEKGKVYLNIHSVTYPNGEIRGTYGLIDGSQTPPGSYPPPATTDVFSTDAGAARFLNHATFGASPADVAYVKANGPQAWITNQLTKTPSRTSSDVVANITADINQPYPSTLFTNAWWKYAVTGQDQLRQRFAFALSEIMVVSWANNTGPLRDNGRILADYHDQLLDYCLPPPPGTLIDDRGTFRGLLKAVTLTPAMGLYLDMRANEKGDMQIGRHPNENYGREIMQLFSIGIYRQWDDGRYVLGADAGLVSTYTQPNIIGLSELLTGWNYAQPNVGNRLPSNFGPGQDPLNPMKLVPTRHELGSKLLLNNVIAPAATGQTPRVSILSIPVNANPCTVNTSTVHGLKTGDTVKIAGATGTYVPAASINASFVVTVTSPTAFTVPVQCTVAGGAAGTVTGATVIQPTYTISNVIPPVTGSQADNTGSVANPIYEGYTHPYDQYGLKELDAAIDNIVNNDNVPPYICRQLIQRLVTSDPSPGYVYRVVQKFKDNGSGVRGDLTAVLTQILLDGEARSSSVTQNSTTFGKQREPMLRLTGPARAFPTTAYSGTYSQLSGLDSHKLRLITSVAHDFSTNFPVSLNFRVNYPPAVPPNPQVTTNPYNNPTSNTYTVQGTAGIASTSTGITGVAPGSPAVVTTSAPHGLATGSTVTITGVTGGTYVHPTFATPIDINGSFVVTSINPTQFSVFVNCTVVPTSVANASFVSGPCRITTFLPHGLVNGNTVTITGVTGGSYSPTINGTFSVTVLDMTSFTIPVQCTAPASSLATAQLVGGAVMDVPATGMINVTYSQPAGSNVMTVNVAGPQTDRPTGTGGIPATIKSKVYLDILSQTKFVALSGSVFTTTNPTQITTSAPHGMTGGETVTISGVTGGTFSPAINGIFTVTFVDASNFTVASNCTVIPTDLTNARATQPTVVHAAGPGGTPADGIYDVQANAPVLTNTFTVTTADTPATGRSGNILIPRITTSYTPSGTEIIYNTNVNHNLQVGNKIWVDVPVVGSPVSDAEYLVSVITDEDHFRTSRTPNPTYGGTYGNPAGANNGITIYPLLPAPLGRSGNVSVDQSTFNLASTEGSLTQSPLNAPTVFNYFFPDYKFPGSLANNGLDSPEFQLTTDTNVTNLTNSLTNMIIGTGGGNGNPNGLSSFNNGSGSVVMSIEPYLTPDARTSNAGIPALIDDLANLLVGAPLEAATKTEIVNFVANNSNFPLTTPTNAEKRDRVRAIIHLIITSAEYAVQK